MEDWLNKKKKLGKTDLYAGPLGFGASYRAPAVALEAAFEAGCNYFYWGALRNKGMTEAIRNIKAKGKRDDLIVVVQVYRKNPKSLEKSLLRGLKKSGLDHADILLLGWYKHPPKPQILDCAEDLRRKGAFRYLGLSGHFRPLFKEMAKEPRFDVFHIRYNAAHRGAEEDIFPFLPEERPGIIAFTATKYMSLVKSRKIPSEENRPTAGDCYRFVLSNPFVDVVTSGPAKARHIEENLKEVAKGPMQENELEWMRRIGDYVYGRKK